MSTSSSTLSTALVARLAKVLGIDLDDDPVDPDASFFDPGGFRFGGVVFDSMDFVEMLVALEDEVGVPILDAPDVEAFDSVNKLAAYITEHADPATLRAFEEKWS